MQNIDWSTLGFKYMDTRCHVRHVWRNGAWDQGELVSDPFLKMHMAASCLHYGQAAFEGLKAFRCRDGRVRVYVSERGLRDLVWFDDEPAAIEYAVRRYIWWEDHLDPGVAHTAE